jgi:glutamate-1-semialdehyde 2,1-aminomutase
MLTFFMSERGIRNFDDVQACDTGRYAALFRHLLERGIYIAPSQFEAMFVSTAHSDGDIDRTIAAINER